MKLFSNCWFILCSLLFASGCASTPRAVLSEPVGPAPREVVVAERRGALLVYSTWDVSAVGDPDRLYREDYTLYWPDNAKVERIHNHLGTLDEGPVALNLPPGTYRIKARASRVGMVTMDVVIAADRATVVRLDGSIPKDVATSTAASVRLPDGKFVGWRASR